MVHFFSIKRNYSITEKLSPSEISVLEHLVNLININLKIEPIEQGVVIYFSDTFSKEQFLKLRNFLLTGAQILDQQHLPERYCEIDDSFLGEHIFYSISNKQYLQNSLNVIKEFIPKKDVEELMSQISKHIIKIPSEEDMVKKGEHGE